MGKIYQIFTFRKDKNPLSSCFRYQIDIVGTVIGVFNAHEIQQLELKFNNFHSRQNMLARVTNQNDEEIKNILDNHGSNGPNSRI
jgi:hypothetical protein